MEITERDVELLRAVLEFRFLTIELYYWLFADASRQNLRNRLKLLYHHKYLNRGVVFVSKSTTLMIYSLSERGARLIAEMDGVSREEIAWSRYLNKITPTHIRHLLSINRVMIAYRTALAVAEAAGRVKSYKVLRGEPGRDRLTVTLKDADGRRHEESVVPDIVMPVIFRSGEYGLFFVEVDRGTMTTRRWRDKVVVYREYARSPELREKYRAGWFILLTVTTSDKRIESLAAATATAGGRRGYWFTTIGQVSPDAAFTQIWVRASDLCGIKNEALVRLATTGETRRVDISDAVGRNRGRTDSP